MLYRYLASHAYETLRDARFKVASPDEFNDKEDCSAEIVGLPSEEMLRKKYGRDDGFIENASKVGINGDAILAALNSEHLPDVSPEDYARIANQTLHGRRPIVRNVRILCLCDADGFPKTDQRMWSRYAGGYKRSQMFCGVRIGIDLICGKFLSPTFLQKVVYTDTVAQIDLSDGIGIDDIHTVKRILSTKTRQWEPERESRVFISPRECIHENGFDFIQFERSMIRRVDIGHQMNPRAMKGLIKMVKTKYPWVEMYRMNIDNHRHLLYTRLA